MCRDRRIPTGWLGSVFYREHFPSSKREEHYPIDQVFWISSLANNLHAPPNRNLELVGVNNSVEGDTLFLTFRCFR